MDTATEEIYFQKLQEHIQDEDKIVTISSVASSLGISINNSRKLMRQYVQDIRKLNPNDLAVTYVLTGEMKDTKEKAVLMVKEDNLLEKQALFDVKPTPVIYSIQKNKNVDFNIIAIIDMFSSTKIREKPLIGSIVSKNSTKRTLKLKKLPPPPAPTLKGKSSFFVPKSEKLNDSCKSTDKLTISESKPQSSGSIATLFKSAAVPSASKSSPKDSVKNSVSPKGKPSSQKNNILTGFLQNGASKSIKTAKSKIISTNNSENEKENNLESRDESSKTNDDVSDIMDVDFDEAIINEDSNVSVRKEFVEKKGLAKKKKLNKRHRDKSQEVPSKRRKRIVERIDSDSDDLFERDAEDIADIIEKSDDEPEREPSPIMKQELPPKNKRRKAVTKTFQDEEGFIVAQTEYVYETASEDENEPPTIPCPSVEEKQQVKPKIKITESKKVIHKSQSTLMNFFKKK